MNLIKINYLILISLILLAIPNIYAEKIVCDHNIATNQGWFPEGTINGNEINPGDIICLQGGERNKIKFNSFSILFRIYIVNAIYPCAF